MTTEHLRPLLSDDAVVVSVGFRLEVQMVRLGWMTAFTKPDGGVRGIAAGDVVRRLVSRTMAHQMGKVVEKATSPLQNALSTKAGTECIAHALHIN